MYQAAKRGDNQPINNQYTAELATETSVKRENTQIQMKDSVQINQSGQFKDIVQNDPLIKKMMDQSQSTNSSHSNIRS